MLEGEHVLLDLCSGNPEEGEIQPEGYVLHDIEPFKGISLVCDLEQLDTHVKQGQCKGIRCSHCLEHFPTSHLPTIFTMIYSLIEDGGYFEVHVPNFLWHAQLLTEGRDEEAVNYCFGGQRDQYDFHKTAFTPAILRKHLTEAGFTIVNMVSEHSIHALAQKN